MKLNHDLNLGFVFADFSQKISCKSEWKGHINHVLIEFKVENFRSIRDEQTLSMMANSYADELESNLITLEVPGLKGARFLRSIALWGGNASGKSNLLAAFRFLISFVRRSATDLEPNALTATEPFKLNVRCKTLPTRFSITGVIENSMLTYDLHLTTERVVHEALVAYPKGRPQVWFERDWDTGSKSYVWSRSSPHFKYDEGLRAKARPNAAFLAVAAQWNHEKATSVWNWLTKGFRILDLSRNLDETGTLEALKNSKLKSQILQLLQRADLGIADAHIVGGAADGKKPKIKITTELEGSDDVLTNDSLRLVQKSMEPIAQAFQRNLQKAFGPKVELLHRGSEGPVPLSFQKEESAGTKRFFSLIGHWLNDLKEGRVVLIDELETSLHPLLVREILQLLTHVPVESRSQLIFTTHNPFLLDTTLFRRDQLWFADKDHSGSSRFYPLTDYSPRKDEALTKGYLAGRYGGIPYLPDGLIWD